MNGPQTWQGNDDSDDDGWPPVIVLTNLEIREVIQIAAALAFWREHRVQAEEELSDFFMEDRHFDDDELAALAERLATSSSADVRRNLQN